VPDHAADVSRIRQDAWVTCVIEPPNSVILLVGREEFTPPQSFGGAAAVATHDCVAVGVVSVDDGATTVTLGPESDRSDSTRLGEFVIETEGQVSVRDIYNREYEALSVEPGRCMVTVWGNDQSEPSVVTLEVRAEAS
jgi:hypothetical protein